MSTGMDSQRVLPFVQQVLEREGAAVESVGGAALFVVLPESLRGALELPSAATTLDLSAGPAEGRQAFPLEGASMQWLIDRARSRGRRAGARLPSPPHGSSGRLRRAQQRLVLQNAKVVSSEALRPVATRLLLEFGYEAQCEERTDGRVLVATTPDGRICSLRLADALGSELGGAVAEMPMVGQAAVQEASARATPLIEAEVRARLGAFCGASRSRLEAERERIVAYHDRLVHEAGRRRGVAAGTLAAKREAIRRQRGERLDDLAERHAVTSSFWLASALVLRYEIGLCRFRVRRRRREIELRVEWDPFLQDFIGPACEACHTASMQLHVCDASGHVTCADCAAACKTCGRVGCRACASAGCNCPAP